MFEWNDVFDNRYRFTLQNIQYNKKMSEKDESELQFGDRLHLDVKTNNISLTFSRHVFFDPETTFDLAIDFVAELSYSKGSLPKELASDHTKLMEFVISEGAGVLSNLSSRASLLVSQITSITGQCPIVLPPASQDGFLSAQYSKKE